MTPDSTTPAPANRGNHTFGPWHIERYGGAYEIWPKDRGHVHSFIGRIMLADDARLIAAAPELAWIAQRLLGIRHPNSGTWTKAETERSMIDLEGTCRAVLAKAIGQGGRR